MSKPTSPVRSAERQRLGEAISRHAEAAETVRRVEQAIQTISESRIADHASIGRARDAVHVARGAQSQILVSRALGEEIFDQPDLDAAQATLAACEAKLDTSRAALRTLEAEARRARATLDLAERALNRAVAEAVAADPALAALRDEFERCRRRMSVLIGTLLGAGVSVSRVAWEETAFRPDPIWVSAIERLREDADAELPGVPPDDPDHAGVRDGRKAA